MSIFIKIVLNISFNPGMKTGMRISGFHFQLLIMCSAFLFLKLVTMLLVTIWLVFRRDQASIAEQ
jgi:hypothetical protein